MAAASTAAAARGRLRIADRVYARIAARAAREALAGVWIGRRVKGAPPTVSVVVPGSTVRVRVGVELPFPADLAALARAVRDRVTTQVNGLTGTRVSEVVVVVERLVTGGRS
ncbi:Asp23/Gls24 family envelope stress response protein [Kitasatospora aureofaciens]|uniref:Asp23/Gls24 family envelope stress response protein n=1 Tax=Kitasatospora aureofaciens TaxID=1894 RepID=UPI001C455FC3|nr:Asp23/Gls24 family envelope stress response protein [Kitasatospora aureofaciens]MBV6699595.1 Asp23/Gls24 family envelope stress response protein [Kitasatospora aureofaciens]